MISEKTDAQIVIFMAHPRCNEPSSYISPKMEEMCQGANGIAAQLTTQLARRWYMCHRVNATDAARLQLDHYQTIISQRVPGGLN